MPQSTTVKNTSPWLDSIADEQRYPKLTKNISSDVVIIGGGIAGIMTAWRLAENGISSVILERNHIATGDTGFTTAFITRVPDTSAAELQKKYGDDFVAKIFSATSNAQEWFKNIIKNEGIDCDYAEIPSFNCTYKDKKDGLTEEWNVIKNADKNSGISDKKELSNFFSGAETAIRFDGEGRYHVRKFLFGLLRKPGAKLISPYEETDATDIEVTEKGVRVTTPNGIVKAKKVIITTGLPHQSFSELQTWLSPKISFVIAAKFKDEAPIGDAMFWDTEEPYQYFRRLDSNTIILGGCDRNASEKSNIDPHQKLKEFLDKWILQGENKPYEIIFKWSGSLFDTEDGLPFISEHPYYKNQVFMATGFGGNGMVCGALGGMILGDLVAGKINEHSKYFDFSRIGKPVPRPAPRPKKPLLERPVLKRVLQILLPLIYISLAIVPGYLFFDARGGTKIISVLPPKDLAGFIFPLFGLYAFFLIWAQLMIGSLMPFLRRVYKRIEIFHRAEGVFALLFGVTHPSLLVFALGIPIYTSFGWTDSSHIWYVILGEVQIFLLMLTATTALLMRLPWLKKNWHVIHYCNYALFTFAWIHGLKLGTDFVGTDGRMKIFWMVLGVTGALSILTRIYRGLTGTYVPGEDSSSGQMKWNTATKESSLQIGQPFRVQVNGKTIAIVKLNDGVFAINNVCGHAGGPLDEGKLEKFVIECPWHGSKFDVRTGEVVTGPATRPQKIYETRIENGEVQVKA